MALLKHKRICGRSQLHFSGIFHSVCLDSCSTDAPGMIYFARRLVHPFVTFRVHILRLYHLHFGKLDLIIDWHTYRYFISFWWTSNSSLVFSTRRSIFWGVSWWTLCHSSLVCFELFLLILYFFLKLYCHQLRVWLSTAYNKDQDKKYNHQSNYNTAHNEHLICNIPLFLNRRLSIYLIIHHNYLLSGRRFWFWHYLP